MRKINRHKLLIIVLYLVILLLAVFSKSRSTSSLELHKRVSVENNITRTDYVDDEGRITYAIDKNYATLVETRENNTVFREFFDEDGNPQRQSGGFFALLRSFNVDDLVEYEYYYDAEGKPVAVEDGTYGLYYEYNEEGQNILLAFLDENGQRTARKDGCAVVRRKFRRLVDDGSFGEENLDSAPVSENNEGLNQEEHSGGLIQEDYYFDLNDEPICLKNGAFATQIEKNEKGLNIRSTSLGRDGKPVMTSDGYATSRRTHFPDGTIETETYFDAEDHPVALSQGQYGLRVDGQKTIYIDQYGNDMFVLSNFLVNSFASVMLAAIVLLCIAILLPEKISFVFLILYVAFILYMTLLYRAGSEGFLKLELFWSYRLFIKDPQMRMEILNNIMLFVPLGALLYKAYPKKNVNNNCRCNYYSHGACVKAQCTCDHRREIACANFSSCCLRAKRFGINVKIIFAAVLLSAVIELLQYFLGIGYCELDDMISNGIGALLGFRTCEVFMANRLTDLKEE